MREGDRERERGRDVAKNKSFRIQRTPIAGTDVVVGTSYTAHMCALAINSSLNESISTCISVYENEYFVCRAMEWTTERERDAERKVLSA